MKKSPKICFSKIKTQKNLNGNFWNGVYALETEKKIFLTYKGLFKKNFFFALKRLFLHQKGWNLVQKLNFSQNFGFLGSKKSKNWIFFKKIFFFFFFSNFFFFQNFFFSIFCKILQFLAIF